MNAYLQGDDRLKDNSSHSWNEVDTFIIVYIHIHRDKIYVLAYECMMINRVGYRNVY